MERESRDWPKPYAQQTHLPGILGETFAKEACYNETFAKLSLYYIRFCTNVRSSMLDVKLFLASIPCSHFYFFLCFSLCFARPPNSLPPSIWYRIYNCVKYGFFLKRTSWKFPPSLVVVSRIGVTTDRENKREKREKGGGRRFISFFLDMANGRRREEEYVSKVLYLYAAVAHYYYSLAILEKSVITLTWEQVK